MTRSRCRYGRFLWAMLVGLAVSAMAPANPSRDDWSQWADAEESLRQQIARVNEGDLAFLERAPSKPVHHHRNRIIVSGSSLQDGWVTLEQCHRNLDRVAAAQILFHPERSRALQVVRYENMGTAEARENTIQLREVGAESEVCLTAQTQALVEIGEGVYELQNGPYMRRFLDGYYPMRVSLDIEYPQQLTLADFTPERQPGFDVSESPGRVTAEAVFEGQLRTRFRFLAD
jgi:hypothetical protein